MNPKEMIETIKKEKGLSNKSLAKILDCNESSIWYVIKGKRSGRGIYFRLVDEFPELLDKVIGG